MLRWPCHSIRFERAGLLQSPTVSSTGPLMAIDRVFLDWDGPALQRAARWLLNHYGQRGRWDLSSVVLVTSGHRSGRRLLELLAALAGPRVFTPPAQVITPGSLFDLLVAAGQRLC